jgi:hypothetical protein
METKYFSLDQSDNSKIVKIFQIVFGILCFAIAIFWLVFNIRSIKADGTSWITIIFLLAFGFYQVYSGLGKATRFIEISSDKIRIRKIIMLPPVIIQVAQIQKIEIYPFNLNIILKSEKKIIVRFGATYQDTNEKIKDEIMIFAEHNSINSEIMVENI